MSTERRFLRGALFGRGLLAMVLPAALASVDAAELKITAEFRPSALNPGHNRFVNTTPQSGYCAQHSNFCRVGDFTIDTGLNVAQRRLYGGGEDPREKWYLSVDGKWREVIVRNASNHELKARLRVFLVGMQWGLPSDGTAPGANGAATGGCRGRIGVGSGAWYRYAWDVPEGTPVCVRNPRATTDQVARYLNFSIGYHLETPNPLQAQDGRYTGSVTYTVGNGQQIDLGQGDYSDSELTLQLLLDVVHDFQVRFSSEFPVVQLAPEGGWVQWIDHGLPPSCLRQELPFHLTTSMEFSMKLRCEHDVADRCGLQNAVNDEVVPVDVDVTIPGMSNVRDGRPAQNTALLPDDARAPRFTPDGYLMQRRSALRFTAGREAVTEMLKSPGSHWQGNMTVVFDADP
ncbi:hypothetical protein [Stenotrophomonas maltophilia]|uniref:Uncharacterized protein n=1 Tax=Stenotrophomonas maltophilia TaxID=40324 RepID=A0AAI9C6U6_STEMA|nr:hypothetical protein [Stenotrophomonas maltophilia]EKT4095209.1 hypothetical protein [Stenotrophomonas maltophilia]ELF4100992.1 hypothetical protein [Stenotrophomonas maltophilia]WQI19067.1 hypothetical protein U2S91_13020 [Stenotrophomonas maltophilia]HDS1130165.1 hypothetical protein [Stenotrophomonas maltophilia]HDS1155465.1 hypothetical protein [Stenotrophomonas maltophilia]